MDHQHAHGPGGHHVQDGRSLSMAFFLNLGFTLVELVGGILTNSVAILSDAIHDLGDSLSLGMSWYLQVKSGKKGDAKYSFGYQRFSLLGALINGLVLVVGSAIILWEALPRLWNPEMPNTEGMIGLAILGVLVNGVAVWRLSSQQSLNERVVRLHLLEDVLGWVVVLIGAIVMQFVAVPILDPLLSLAIAGWVGFNAVRNLRKSLKIFLQAVPSDKDITAIQSQIEALEEVEDVHDIHLWTLDGEFDIFTVHVKAKEAATLADARIIKEKIQEIVEGEGVHHSTIEVEALDEPCAQVDC